MYLTQPLPSDRTRRPNRRGILCADGWASRVLRKGRPVHIDGRLVGFERGGALNRWPGLKLGSGAVWHGCQCGSLVCETTKVYP